MNVYKVVHRITSFCLQQSYVAQISVSGDLKVSMYPNPTESDSPITLEMTSDSEVATVEIYDIITDQLVFKKTLEHGQRISIGARELGQG